MATRWEKLEATYARRREAEHNRVERTEAINRYYDHWDKVTARYQTWCGPEYYSKAEEKLKLEKEKKAKAALLLERQEKMRKLLESERIAHEKLLREQRRPNSRKVTASTELLQKIEHNMKDRANMRKKLELEAKLYGRWRYGVDDDHRLFETKNDHEVLAKLNWLDKQIENEQQREQDQKESEERNLRLQTELAKIETAQKERQTIRKQEIEEIHALQEKHMEELHKRQQQTDLLKNTEHSIRMFLDELGKETQLLDESSAMIMEPDGQFSQSFNLKKIKIYIRKRSELFRRQIKLSLGILERMENYSRNCKKLKALKDKYREQQEAESKLMSQIDSMYESEAKYNLQRLEDQWQAQHRIRYQELKELITNKSRAFKEQLSDNLQRQQDIIEIRNTHLKAIERTTEKLKELMKEREDSPRFNVENEPETPNNGVGANTVFQTSAATLPSELAAHNNGTHNLKSPRPYSDPAAGKSSESMKSPREFLEPHEQQYFAHKQANNVKSSSQYSDPAAGKSSESMKSPREFLEPHNNQYFAHKRTASVKSHCDYTDNAAGKTSESMKSSRDFLEPHDKQHFSHKQTANFRSPCKYSDQGPEKSSGSMKSPREFLEPLGKQYFAHKQPSNVKSPCQYSDLAAGKTSESMKSAREFLHPHNNDHKSAININVPCQYAELAAGSFSGHSTTARKLLESNNNKSHALAAGISTNPSEPAAGRSSESMATPHDFLGPHKKHFPTSESPREDLIPARFASSKTNKTSLDFPMNCLGAAGLACSKPEPLEPSLKSPHRAPTVFSATSGDKDTLHLPSTHPMKHLSSSFEHLNLDLADDVPSPRTGAAELRLQNTRLDNVVNSANVEPPKFGRKRVAWT